MSRSTALSASVTLAAALVLFLRSSEESFDLLLDDPMPARRPPARREAAVDGVGLSQSCSAAASARRQPRRLLAEQTRGRERRAVGARCGAEAIGGAIRGLPEVWRLPKGGELRCWGVQLRTRAETHTPPQRALPPRGMRLRGRAALLLGAAALAMASFHLGASAAWRRAQEAEHGGGFAAAVERRELAARAAGPGGRAARAGRAAAPPEGATSSLVAPGGNTFAAAPPRGRPEVISWSPRASVWRGFLSSAEADAIVRRARPLMERSKVVNSDGSGAESSARTSRGAFLPRHNESAVREVEDRIAAWTGLPWFHAEAMQVLQYERGEQYVGHPDWFDVDERGGIATHLKNGGQRVATVLMYLSDVDAGGETVFPKADLADPENARVASAAAAVAPQRRSKCAAKGVAVAPRKGDALLFWNTHPDGTGDEASYHAGCPVEGERTKWTATKWIRAKRHSAAGEMPPSLCMDDEEGCERCVRVAARMSGPNVEEKSQSSDVAWMALSSSSVGRPPASVMLTPASCSVWTALTAPAHCPAGRSARTRGNDRTLG